MEGTQERYRLDWPGKREALALANTPVALTLRPCREESVDFENTQNLYIEGDNLDALKLLQETYLGKVKMIYIDPPYNTGNDFIYEDDFTAEQEVYQRGAGEKDEKGNRMIDEERWKQNSATNGRFHSDWLSMIYPRLKLARNLLQPDGVIFLSIDDNEVSNLTKALDEVFGTDNFLFRATLLCNPKGRSHDKYVANCHEYVLAYSREELPKESLNIPKSPEEIALDYRLRDSKGFYRELELRNTHREFGKHNRPRLYYPFFVDPNTAMVFLENDDQSSRNPVLPDWDDGFEGCWTWGKEKAVAELDDLVAKVIKGEWKIYRKGYAGKDGEVASKKVKSIWTERSLQTEKGQAMFNSLFDTREKLFQSPKSVALLAQLAQMATNDNDIILDFFSGSATTAQAVMQLNAEDGGKRRHIMVQLPEPCDEKSEAFKAGYKTIAEIGKERIRRAGKKVLAEWQAKQAKEQGAERDLLHPPSTISDPPSPPDIGFRVLKIDSSNFADIQRTPDELDQKELALHTEHIKPDRTAEDLLFQVLVDWGVDLALPITEETLDGKSVFFVDENALAACFDAGLSEETIKAIAARMPMRAVFRDEGYGDDSSRINVEQLFKLLSPGTELKSL